MADRQQPTTSTPASLRIFGHTLPADLVAAVADDMQTPLLNEGWFVASVVWGGAAAALTFVLFGAPFFAGMPHSDPAAVRTVLWIALLVGAAAGLGGLAVHRQLRRSQGQAPAAALATRHRAVAGQRLLVAGLLLLFGAAGLWHAWFFAPSTRVLGLLTFVLALGLGLRALPALLAFAAGQNRRLTRAARALDRLLLLGIGLLGALIALPPIANAEPGAFFLALTQLLGLLALPWVAPMLAAARIHRLYAARGD